MANLFSRMKEGLKHGWNLFLEEKYLGIHSHGGHGSYGSYAPQRTRGSYSSERSIISSIYTRLGIDVSGVDIRHARLDEEGRYLEDIHSSLLDCLTV